MEGGHSCLPDEISARRVRADRNVCPPEDLTSRTIAHRCSQPGAGWFAGRGTGAALSRVFWINETVATEGSVRKRRFRLTLVCLGLERPRRGFAPKGAYQRLGHSVYPDELGLIGFNLSEDLRTDHPGRGLVGSRLHRQPPEDSPARVHYSGRATGAVPGYPFVPYGPLRRLLAPLPRTPGTTWN